VVVGLFALAVLLNTANWTMHFHASGGYLAQPQMDAFRHLFPAPEAVYVDGVNVIKLFMHHHDWRWRFVGRNRSESQDLWHVVNGTRAFYVCKDTTGVLLDLSEDATYERLAACLETTGARQVAVFRPQAENGRPPWPIEQTVTVAERGASRAGLTAKSMAVIGTDVYAGFARSMSSTAATTGSSETEPSIEVLQATYGSNCGADRGNATRNVAGVCDRTATCDYRVDVTRLGDPAPGCAKQFDVDYRCSSGLAMQVTLPAEAGFGGLVALRCP
jgi:hypothetical protein